ncbi:Mitochondrial carrier [Nesidiocoris tenuis]|uniref:Mitochondrial carrier n=1 Tax=Nesidiocoris tenuis TaxID=355587 RepID=A0ABN7A5F9_9HEMI|nr:Mitochondrial carrier [Nesidiocoris tenuis]
MSIQFLPSGTFSSIGVRLCVDTITHPLEYAKFLMQIGHEPLPPYPTKTLWGTPTMGLPNCFKYVQYIKNMDGWAGCYRGCVPKLIGRTLASAAANSAVSYLELDKSSDLSEEMELSDDEKLNCLRTTLIKDLVGRTVLVAVSQPFIVISNRMMAQFIGGEETYSGIFASIVEIFREQGLRGFYSGVMPRWIGDLVYTLTSSLVIYSLNNYVIADKELRSFTSPAVQYATNSLTYQFTVVSSCMSINNCGLIAGIPPNMPIYRNWWSCRQHLSILGQLNRGSSPIFRYYLGPPHELKALAAY